MENNAFTPLAALQLPSPCRLLATACCPDKDLVVLISRLGGKDRMSLWKMQGSKKWDADLGSEDSSGEEIVGLAWSPNGQSIAVAHDPPRITLHSIQDGREERVLTINTTANPQRRSFHVTGVWWFQQEKVMTDSSIPDIFKRNNVITGSAHSILKTLPLLDHLQEDAHDVTATDLFAFQGSHTRSAPKSPLPDTIKYWPTLLPDPLSASISTPLQADQQHLGRGGVANDVDDSNVNSLLIVADNLGHLHYFLDGSYPLGTVYLGPELSTPSLVKDPKCPVFFAHPQALVDSATITDLRPLTVQLPLLEQRQPRDLADLSSTARDLAWYAMRVIKEMRAVWFGSDTYSGARELGPKWVRALEAKQQDQFGQEEPNSILDLTCLLVTGRASESLADLLGNGEHMSERGIQKWESTVTEALVKLRDFSEKRVAPACQRLHIVLEEVEGWSRLPPYASFELPTDEIKSCLDLASRAIAIASWLAAVVRRELSRFKEFITWLRFETAIANPGENHLSPRHDILEVNNYFMSGLVVSSIDKWFMGPVPQFSRSELGIPGDTQDLSTVLQQARQVASNPAQMAWQLNVKQKDLSHLDRNLDALIQELATRCQRVFVRASSAVGRAAVVTSGPGSITRAADTRLASSRYPLVVRERIVGDQTGDFFQYLALYTPSGNRTLLCLARMRYGRKTSGLPLHVGICVLECSLPGDVSESREESVNCDLLQVDFFDDESVVIVYRIGGEGGRTFLATVTYNDLGYQELQPDGYVNISTREDLMANAIQRWKEGHLPSVRIPIKRARELNTCRQGEVSLAVNGRVGRRVSCLLDGKGTSMEIFDLEGDGEAEEDPEGEEAETS